MYLPEGLTEEEVVRDIEKVVKEFSKTYAFGYFDNDDIMQQARMEAIIKLPKYKSVSKSGKPQPLANFLYTVMKRKILNLRRDKYKRNDPPCRLCHNGRHNEHLDGKVCRKYQIWRKTNSTKANLTRPLTLDGVSEEGESNIAVNDVTIDNANLNNIKETIDHKLDPSLRADYLRMIAKEKIPKIRRERVEAAVKLIIKDLEV